MFTTAGQLFENYDCIGIGDYAPHGDGITTKMRRAMNNRSLIGRFKEVLSWVALKSGKTFMIFDEKGTTRTCCDCGIALEVGLNPSIREWICPHCHSFHLRDENSAQNGLKKVLRDLKEKSEVYATHVSGSDLVQVIERWAWRVLLKGSLNNNLYNYRGEKRFRSIGFFRGEYQWKPLRKNPLEMNRFFPREL